MKFIPKVTDRYGIIFQNNAPLATPGDPIQTFQDPNVVVGAALNAWWPGPVKPNNIGLNTFRELARQRFPFGVRNNADQH
jgi:hypothetical protein